jgi:spore coat protein JB
MMNNHNMNGGGSCRERHALLATLQAEDFVALEAALYLNTHPNDSAALEFFKEHKAKAASLREEFESIYGPLTINAAKGDTWSWISSPWPWEKEAN